MEFLKRCWETNSLPQHKSWAVKQRVLVYKTLGQQWLNINKPPHVFSVHTQSIHLTILLIACISVRTQPIHFTKLLGACWSIIWLIWNEFSFHCMWIVAAFAPNNFVKRIGCVRTETCTYATNSLNEIIRSKSSYYSHVLGRKIRFKSTKSKINRHTTRTNIFFQQFVINISKNNGSFDNPRCELHQK